MTTDALPLPVVLAGGASVVMGTAAILSSRATTRPSLPASRWHRPLPAAVRTVAERRSTRAVMGTIGLAAVGVATAALATTGAPVDAGTAVGVTVVAAALTGPPVRWLNPARLASGADPAGSGAEAVGWPAVAWLAVVVAVAASIDDGQVLAVALATVTLAQAALARRRGPPWHPRGDPFDAVVAFVGQVAPLGRDSDDHLGWRNPIVSAAHAAASPAVLGVTAVLAGYALTAVAVADRTARPATTLLVLALTTSAAGATLRVGIIRPYMRSTLAPVAAAYGVLLIDARPLWPVAPLVFVGLHAAAVAVLHRQTIARHDPRTARAVQFPARSAVVVSVLAGLWACLGT